MFVFVFLGGSFYFSNFQFHSLIFFADPQIFIIFQQFLYVGISFFDFFDFLYLSILLLVKKKKKKKTMFGPRYRLEFGQIQGLNLGKHTFSKIMNLGKQNYWAMV